MGTTVKPRVVIIGGGGTGAAVAYDCVLRGYRVLLLEKGSFTSGTTGRHHGLLHSGARYVAGDLQAAAECWHESQILRRITNGVIEDNGGYFVSVREKDDIAYAQQFEEGCRQARIPFRAVGTDELAATVPALTKDVQAAYAVPDASFDAWRLPMQFFASALAEGAGVRQFCEVLDIEVVDGMIDGVRYIDYEHQREERVRCDVVVNAAGVWAARVGALCSVSIALQARAGTMVSVRERMCDYVLNRLAPASNGDIVVPQRGQSIVGTTESVCEDIDLVRGSEQEVRELQARADELLPGFSTRKVHAVWAAARPLAGAQSDSSRDISRKMKCYNHREDGVDGLFSVIGGKATTLRAMAEELVDMIDIHTGHPVPCVTAQRPLVSFQKFYLHYTSARHERTMHEWMR